MAAHGMREPECHCEQEIGVINVKNDICQNTRVRSANLSGIFLKHVSNIYIGTAFNKKESLKL